MKKSTFLLRCGYIVVIAGLFFWLISGMGSRPKNFSKIESSITKILAGQSVDSAKRLEVVDYLNRRLSDDKSGVAQPDKATILKMIRDGNELNLNERRQLFEWVNYHTGLTVKMPEK